MKTVAPPPESASICRRAIIWWLPLLYLLISTSFYLRTYDSAQVKITLLQMGGLSLVAFWLCRLIEDGRDAFAKEDLPILAPFVAFLLSGVFSFLHAPYHWSSLDFVLRRVFYMTIALIIITEFNPPAISRLVRVLIASTWIAVIYGTIQWLDFRHEYLFHNAVLAAAFSSFHRFDVSLFGATGVLRGFDPFIWHGAFGDRVFSTYGNPNFYADYLVIMFPIIAMQFFETMRLDLLARSVREREASLFFQFLGAFRWRFLLLMALDVFNIDASQTKGAWIGLGISIALLTVTAFYFFLWDELSRVLRWASVTAMILLVGVGSVVMGKSIRKKLEESNYTSVNFRLFTWEATWEMIMTKPLLGTGIGSFWVIYPAFRRPPIFHIEGKHNTETDHAEDEYLEVLFDEGILGFGIFVWLIGSCFVMAYRALSQMTGGLKSGERAPPRSLELLGFLVAFQGMLAHNFFDVSMRFVSSGVYLGLLSGMVVNLSRGVSLAELRERRSGKASDESPPLGTVPEGSAFGEPVLWLLRLAAWAGAAFFLGVLLTQFNEIQAPAQQIHNNGEALQWIIGWGCLLYCAGRIAWHIAQAVWRTRNVLVPFCFLGMLPLINLCWGFFRADVFQNVAIAYSRARQWDQAIKYYSKVGELNPAYIMAFYFMGNVFTDRFNTPEYPVVKVYNPDWGDTDGVPRDDFDRALAAFGGVAARSPNYVQMHHQIGTLFLKHGDWLIHQGRVAEGQRDWDTALEYFDKYRKIDPVFAPNYYRMAQVYIFRGQYAKAAEVYESLIEARECAVKPSWLQNDRLRESLLAYQSYVLRNGQWVHLHESAETYTNLGGAYAMLGDGARARAALTRALELDANYQPALQNMRIIQQRLGAAAGARPLPPVVPVGPAVPAFELGTPRR